MNELIWNHLKESCSAKCRVDVDQVAALAAHIVKVFKRGNKILIFGNGGSAADAQHFAAEFVVKYKNVRRALPAIALTTDTSVLTAAGNDFGFDEVFARQVEALGNKGDLAIGISTSGRSPNVLIGLKKAREKGLSIAILTGDCGVPNIHYAVNVPSTVTAHIQEAHIAIIHAICSYVDSKI